jgi:hypothetical protein
MEEAFALEENVKSEESSEEEELYSLKTVTNPANPTQDCYFTSIVVVLVKSIWML